MTEFFTAEIMAALATLTILEIVLGIDNIVFISIISSRLPKEKRNAARKLGLIGALVIRLLFLFLVSWIIGLDADVFQVFGHDFSWKDIILIGGGLFLLAKGTREIHVSIEGEEEQPVSGKKASANMFLMIVAQIMVLDVVFSIDSILTAIGMTQIIEIMVIAIVISIGVMMWAVTPVSAFIEKHPTVKMLALSFLLLIGVALIADGTGTHIPRGYLYFAIVFSIFVEVLNLAAAKRKKRKKK
ncbi:MAG: TerC family protein [Sphingomonadales bacterium]